MRSKINHFLHLALALGLCAFAGCSTGSPTPDETAASAKKAEPKADEQDGKRAERQNLGPLERELARIEDQAQTKLFSNESSCQMTELRDCRKAESKQLWLPAGMCYRDQVDASKSAQCRPWQLIKAAANFERGGERDIAVETRMKAIRTAGPYAAVLTVDTADWLADHGRVGRAQFFYRIYLSQQPDGPLTDYIKGQCAELGISCSAQQKAPQGGPAAPTGAQ